MQEEGLEAGMMEENKPKSKITFGSICYRCVHFTGCICIGLLGASIDGPAIFGIALWKSPMYLWKGWKVTLAAQDQYGACFTYTMLCIWPFRVLYYFFTSVVYGIGKGLKGGVIAYQEDSLSYGFKHIVAAVSEYDEYTNDVVLLREGSCLPRPTYTKANPDDDSHNAGGGGTVIKDLKLEKVIEFMKSETGQEKAGRRLIEEGLISVDRSSSSSSSISSEVPLEAAALIILSYLVDTQEELRHEVVAYDPLETLHTQIRDEKLQKEEKECLSNLVLIKQPEATEAKLQAMAAMKKATLEAFGRRIRGISGFVCGDAGFKKCYAEFAKCVSKEKIDVVIQR